MRHWLPFFQGEPIISERKTKCIGKLVAVWHGIVWYLREISGEARYDHYLEHFAAEHPGETPMSEVEFIRAREEYDRLHPNTSCCC